MDFLNNLQDIGTYIPLLQMLIGGVVVLFKNWIPDESNIKKEIDLIKSNNLELISDNLEQIFERHCNSSIPLRGEKSITEKKHIYSDLLFNYSKNILKICNDEIKLNYSFNWIRRLTNFLLITAIIGILLFLYNIFIHIGINIIIMLIGIFIITQIVTIIFLRIIRLKIFEYIY